MVSCQALAASHLAVGSEVKAQGTSVWDVWDVECLGEMRIVSGRSTFVCLAMYLPGRQGIGPLAGRIAPAALLDVGWPSEDGSHGLRLLVQPRAPAAVFTAA